MPPAKNSTKTQTDKQVENLIAELRHRYDPLEMIVQERYRGPAETRHLDH